MVSEAAAGHTGRERHGGARVMDRALDRARALHAMRGALLLVISLVVGASFIVSIVWIALMVLEHPLAIRFVVLSGVIGIVVDLVVLFLAWMVLEALGRIERETDRVQQFMDNVYRRMT